MAYNPYGGGPAPPGAPGGPQQLPPQQGGGVESNPFGATANPFGNGAMSSGAPPMQPGGGMGGAPPPGPGGFGMAPPGPPGPAGPGNNMMAPPPPGAGVQPPMNPYGAGGPGGPAQGGPPPPPGAGGVAPPGPFAPMQMQQPGPPPVPGGAAQTPFGAPGPGMAGPPMPGQGPFGAQGPQPGMAPPPPGPQMAAPPQGGGYMAGATGTPGYGGNEAHYAELLRQTEELNCAPHFLRTTMGRVPQSLGAKQKVGVPLGCVIQPLASPPEGTEDIKVVHRTQPQNGRAETTPIVRCKKCRTYINPYVQWEYNGRRWKCNLCGFTNETMNAYYAPVDERGQRADLHERPELSNGAVEFIATGDYMVRAPQPPVFMFVIEVGAHAVSSGYTAEVCAGLKQTLQSGEVPGGDRTMCGIMTFDNSVHFYNLDSNLSSAQMVVVSDLDDIFLPLPDDIIVNLTENVDNLCNLLDQIPHLFKDSKVVDSCLGTAITGAYLSMKHVGGKVLGFVASIPTLGQVGVLKPNRDNPRLQGTDKEVELLRPANEEYKDLAHKLIYYQMSVDLFVAPRAYFDLATVKLLSQFTGGEVRFYDNFTPQSQGAKLRQEIEHVVTRFSGWESVMRVRVSKGWRISHFFGNLLIRGQDLLTVPNCHRDFSFAITVEMEDNVSVVEPQCFVQAALLYTNHEAERRVRVLTHCIVASNNHQELVQSVDPQVAAQILAHTACDRALKQSLQEARHFLTNTCTHIVQNSAHIADQGNFAFLPLYVFGILKSTALRAGGGPDLRFDVRAACWTRLNTVCTDKAASLFVPRLLPVDDLSDPIGGEDENGVTVLPEKLPLTGASLRPNGAFLIENGEQIILFIGQEIDPNWLMSLFGVQSVQELPPDGSTYEEEILAPNNNPLKEKFLNVIDYLRRENDVPYMSFSLTHQGRHDMIERRFWDMLIEDKGAGMQVNFSEFADRMKKGFRG
ncbi:unnamed protein product [Amoebophrya sp. A25]|nr:unnamed protein product [Amoebophrya sp. A25]|eukprot:GSA25T00003754001.1